MSRTKTGQTFSCQHCGSEFYRHAYFIKQRANIRFCSAVCRKAANDAGTLKAGPPPGPRPYRLNGKEIHCIICGKSVYRKASMIEYGIDKTCSVECRSKWLVGERNHFYGLKATRPRTNFTESQKAKWLGKECVRCGATTRLELDHVIPRGPSTRENAQTLCRTCNGRKRWFEDIPHYRLTPSGGQG